MKLFCTNNISIVDNVDICSILHYRVNSCVSALLCFCTNWTLIVGNLFLFIL